MRHLLVVLAVAGMAVWAAGCASVQGYTEQPSKMTNIKRIAVASVRGQLDSEAARGQISDFFAEHIDQRGYSTIGWGEARATLMAAKIDPQDAVAAGKALDADALLYINIPEWGQEMSIDARLVDARDGTTLWSGNGTGNTERTLSTIGGAVAGVVAGAAIGGGHGTGAVVGGVMGGAGGGLAGYYLSPKEESVARKVVVDICKSFPDRY